MKGTTPVYNLLPDILSKLSAEACLPQKGFQDIMRHLLQYIGKEKHADSLVDKLCGRFEATDQMKQWRNLAFCIAQVLPFGPCYTGSRFHVLLCTQRWTLPCLKEALAVTTGGVWGRRHNVLCITGSRLAG